MSRVGEFVTTPQPDIGIEVRGVSTQSRRTEILKNVSFSVKRGSVCALIGPNGAGKSTLIRCIVGLTSLSRGEIFLNGERPRPTTFERIGYVPDAAGLYPWLTVRDHLEMYSRAYKRFDRKFATDLASTFGLQPRSRPARLSKGQRTGLSIILAFSTKPDVLILDEPTSGLDPDLQSVLLSLVISQAANGASIFFSTHSVGDAERAADRVMILNDGAVIRDESMEFIRANERDIEFATDAPQRDAELLRRDLRVHGVEHFESTLRLHVRNGSDDLAASLKGRGFRQVTISPVTLETIYKRENLRMTESGRD